MVMILLSSCSKSNQKTEQAVEQENFKQGSFGYDLNFLRDYDSALVLLTDALSLLRNVSAEIYVVCEGYVNPAKIDPKLLDPRFVFKDIEEPAKLPDIFATKVRDCDAVSHL